MGLNCCFRNNYIPLLEEDSKNPIYPKSYYIKKKNEIMSKNNGVYEFDFYYDHNSLSPYKTYHEFSKLRDDRYGDHVNDGIVCFEVDYDFDTKKQTNMIFLRKLLKYEHIFYKLIKFCDFETVTILGFAYSLNLTKTTLFNKDNKDNNKTDIFKIYKEGRVLKLMEYYMKKLIFESFKSKYNFNCFRKFEGFSHHISLSNMKFENLFVLLNEEDFSIQNENILFNIDGRFYYTTSNIARCKCKITVFFEKKYYTSVIMETLDFDFSLGNINFVKKFYDITIKCF